MTRRALWILGLALFAGFGVAQLGALDTMSDRGTGVLAFEFVATSERAEEIVAGWGDEGRDAARAHLLLDYGYLAGYGLLLWLGATWAGARRLALLGPIAAICDALENAALLAVAGGTTAQPWPLLGTAFATLKFAAISVCLLAIAALRLRRRRAP